MVTADTASKTDTQHKEASAMHLARERLWPVLDDDGFPLVAEMLANDDPPENYENLFIPVGSALRALRALSSALEEARVENARLREALKEIARQNLHAEITDSDPDEMDWLCGYEECVKTARAALKETSHATKESDNAGPDDRDAYYLTHGLREEDMP